MPVPVRHRRRVRQVELIALVLLVSAPMAAPPLPFTGGRDVFVAPDGRDDGLGTCDAPLSLARAVSGRADVQQGDRIWLRGGRYGGGVTSRISGSAWAPIRVRGLPGERAVIDNAGSGRDAITVLGSWTEWHDLEITNRAVVALAVFLIWELTDKDPIVDLKLFRHRNFRAGTLAMVVAYAAFFSVSLLIPQWLQRDMGYTAIWAGLATAPIGILPVIMTPFVGKYASRFDMRMIASFAFVFLSFTSFMRSDFNLQVDYAHVAGVQLIMGIGVALFFMPVLQILLSDLDGREIAAGSGLATFLRTLGGSFAASLTTWLWARRTQVHHADLTEHISAYQPGMQDQVAAMGQGNLQNGAAVLNNMINHQASQMAFNDIFYLLGWTFLAIIAFLWLAKPPFGAGAGAASAGGH